MRKSKFVGIMSNGYTCVGCEVADVQPKTCRKKLTITGRKAKTKSPYSKQYQYPFVKLTSDGKALKHITLSAAQVRKVYNGLATVEDYVKQRERNRSRTAKTDIKERVNYCFCD